ncbi:MAG: c-type cytochrome biogenesis protein CcmI [Cognaticolwellia sp.]
MTIFWLAISLLLLIALLIVWQIFTASSNQMGAENNDIRQETNVTLYHEHLANLENDLAEASIDHESFEQLKAELDKTLLQDANVDGAQKVAQHHRSWRWPFAIALSLVGFSLYAYMSLGAYSQLSTPSGLTENQAHSDLTPEQMLAVRLQQLQSEVKKDANNSQAWFSLGQAYISAGEFDQAIAAFDQVMTQVGEHAELLGPKAQAMYYKNNQQINSEIQSVIDKALALDSQDAATNILLGMDSFSQQKFAKAVQYWETVLNSGRPGISTQALMGAVAEAKNQLRIRSETSSSAGLSDNVDDNLPRLLVNVSLGDNVQQALMNSEDKTVFVYAIAADGPRMPLAAVKIKASDLPLSIVLDDSQAMTPQMRLSSVDKVHVYAVVSMQGSVGIKAGDFKAQALNIDAMDKSPIEMQISALVP